MVVEVGDEGAQGAVGEGRPRVADVVGRGDGLERRAHAGEGRGVHEGREVAEVLVERRAADTGGGHELCDAERFGVAGVEGGGGGPDEGVARAGGARVFDGHRTSFLRM